MTERIYICQQCQTLFRLLPSEKEVKCPECGGTHLDMVPSWEPIGARCYSGSPEWEYRCGECQTVFRLPVPAGPAEEKEAKCPHCESTHVERLTPVVFESTFFG